MENLCKSLLIYWSNIDLLTAFLEEGYEKEERLE